MKNKIIEILKEFEQTDYKRGGVSIAPEMYEAIANKIKHNIMERGVKYKCKDNDAVLKFFVEDGIVDEFWVKIDGEVGWTVVGYKDFLNGVKKAIDKSTPFDCHKCKHSFMNPFDQYFCMKKDKNGEEYDLEADKDCGGKYFEKEK